MPPEEFLFVRQQAVLLKEVLELLESLLLGKVIVLDLVVVITSRRIHQDGVCVSDIIKLPLKAQAISLRVFGR